MLSLIMIVVGFLIMWMTYKPIEDTKANLVEKKKIALSTFLNHFL